MQRRKLVDHSSSAKNGAGAGSSNNFSASTKLNRKYVLPINSNNKIKIKTKQQKKKTSTVSILVQIIVVLMIATSLMMIYIAARGGGENDAVASKSSNDLTDSHEIVSPIKMRHDSKTAQVHFPKDNTSFEQNDTSGTIEVGDGDGKVSDNEGTNGGEVDTGDLKQDAQETIIDGNIQTHIERKRTTKEANAYMAQQTSFAVDGEIALKKKLLSLDDLQRKGLEHESPIITRWVGETNENGEEMKYWLPKSSTSEAAIETWKVSVEEMKDQMRRKDIELYPLLHDPVPETKSDSISKHVDKVKKAIDDRSSKKEKGAILSGYPKPEPDGTHVVLKPTFGKHREKVNAVFALAEGYDLNIYLLFIESLIATGFNGDVVLSVSALDSLKPGVEEYLRSKQIGDGEKGINIIAYTVSWICYTGDGNIANGANEGIRKCELVGMYGEDADEHIVTDTREPRPVATARFELYWAWSQYYKKENWIMLIDSRDAHFQLDPFSDLPDKIEGDEGLLYFFAENAQQTKIGDSSFNSRWLKDAYGEEKVKAFFDKPIICSGSTMGQQAAMEPYLRAMIAQFDETKCALKGCDQGFHNYLHYSNSLSGLSGIKEVKVYDQGTSIINNLGVLRSKPLREWGLLNENNEVLNWDGKVSPVAHQFDRDDELNKHLKQIRKEYEDQYKANKLLKSVDTTYDPPAPDGTHVILQPTFGKHRPHVDAIFGLAEGYDLRIYLLFIESLIETGFSGDLVLSVSSLGSLKEGVEKYLRSHHKEESEEGLNVVVYTVSWDCFESDGTKADGAKEGTRKCKLVGMYGNDTDNEAIEDPRDARPVATARFELYWAWSQYYDKHNWIMLIDTRDAHFQLDPFAELDHSDSESKAKDDGVLYFFAENAKETKIRDSKFNSRWLKTAYGDDKVKSFFDKPIICSGSTMGQQVAMESYLRAMIAQFDETKCALKGCDQGFHNYLYYSNSLNKLKEIRTVVEFEQGTGIINNLGILRSKPLREWGILNENNVVLNWDGKVSPVAHQFDRDDELNKHLKAVRRDYATKFWASNA